MVCRRKWFRDPGPKLLLVVLTCFFAGVTLAWLHLHRAPPWWDDAWYLTNSLAMFDALMQKGVVGYAHKFFGILGTKAPLMTVLPTPIYLLLGRNFKYAFLVNVCLMPALFLAVYRIGKRYWNGRGGLIAVYIVGTMPLLYGLSRWYMAEYALTTVVCVALYFLIDSRCFADTRTALKFGITCGFGVLLKVSFPIYVIFPFLYTFIRFLGATRHSAAEGGAPKASRARTVLALVVPAFLLSLPWYLFNARRIFQATLTSGFSKEADVYGTGRVFSASAIKSYLVGLVNEGPSCWYVFLAVLLLVVLVSRGKARAFVHTLPQEGRVILLLWTLPFLVFLFGRNKDVRFVAPILPAFALVLALALDFAAAGLGRWRSPILCLLLVFPLIALLQASFAILGGGVMRAGDFMLIAPDLFYARAYRSGEGPQEDILRAICENARFSAREEKSVMVGTDCAGLNSTNLELTAIQERLPLHLESTAHVENVDALLAAVRSAAYFIYKEGGESESPFLNQYAESARRQVQNDPSFAEIPYRRKLPDGGIVHILKNLSTELSASGTFIPARYGCFPACAIDFEHKIELTGLAIKQTKDSLEVDYRWQSVNSVGREYWCFTQILNAPGKIIGYLDHDLLRGDPPTPSWRAGDQALEHMSFKFSEPVVGEELRLKIGLYHVDSGQRLRIVGSPTLATKPLTLADGNTAAIVECPSTHSGRDPGGP